MIGGWRGERVPNRWRAVPFERACGRPVRAGGANGCVDPPVVGRSRRQGCRSRDGIALRRAGGASDHDVGECRVGSHLDGSVGLARSAVGVEGPRKSATVGPGGSARNWGRHRRNAVGDEKGGNVAATLLGCDEPLPVGGAVAVLVELDAVVGEIAVDPALNHGGDIERASRVFDRRILDRAGRGDRWLSVPGHRRGSPTRSHPVNPGGRRGRGVVLVVGKHR